MENDSPRRITRGQSQPVVISGRRVDAARFKDVWRILHRAGWDSKPPQRRSLDNRYRYIPPGGNVNGKEGRDFFLGEESLVEHYESLSGEKPSRDGDTEAMDIATAGARRERDQSTNLSVPKSQVSGNRSLFACATSGSIPAPCGTREAIPQSEHDLEEQKDAEVHSDAWSNVQHSLAQSISATVCVVCQMECSLERSCSNCGAFMHHFCSHDVCARLDLHDSNGEAIVDFGESCYCSEKCYMAATANRSEVIWTHHLYTARRDSQPSLDGHAADLVPVSALSNTTVPMPLTKRKTTSIAVVKTCDRATTITEHTKRKRQKAKHPSPLKRTSATSSEKTSPPTKKNTRKPGSSSSVFKAKKKGKKSTSNVDATFRSELLRRIQTSADRFINAKVSFSPAEESWMPAKSYRDVGAAYLTGIITRYVIEEMESGERVKVPTPMFKLLWTNTAFQSKDHVHGISEDVVVRGVAQFVRLHRGQIEFMESWSSLCSMVPKYSNIPALTEEYEELDEADYRELSAFRGRKELQIALSPDEVEAIESMTFVPTGSLEQPAGLFTHADGSTKTKVHESSRKYFGHSATSSFFAFLPISFWKQVVEFSNAYAVERGNASRQPITLDELMIFLGILWYMSLVDKGEMKNYWRDNEESRIFPGSGSTNMAGVMVWNRFIYIRKNLAFRAEVTPREMERDPAARIRPLLTILKTRCKRHVVVGRNVAVDEASVACRSKYARHIIVYNPRKPTGKCHFKFYMCCCSTTWFVVDFKLHCDSELHDRLEGVLETSEIVRLAEATKKSSEIRRHVLEVTNSLKGSRRIVNTDNFYTSCLLLESLRSVGLHGRGTVRSSSKHFPHFTMLDPKVDKDRGSMKQGVCLDKHIVAASWMDGSIVNIISNADDSSTTTVLRRIKQDRVGFEAPTCVSEYNAAMQGVDRHDQLRGRFSIADGHSFKKWHKKVAMSAIDIARCNAYICHGLAAGGLNNDGGSDSSHCEDSNVPQGRDPHRVFVAELVRELFDGSWKKWLSPAEGIAYAGEDPTSTQVIQALSESNRSSVTESAVPICVAKESSVILKNRSRAKRECTVCRFEGRVPTQKTDFCETHHVALCKRSYSVDSTKSHLCQEVSWTCWQKFHHYYLPRKVYSLGGNLLRSSAIYKAQAQFIRRRNKDRSRCATNETSCPESTEDADSFATSCTC